MAATEKMKIVLTHGCFDILHYGHLCHLRAARRMGDLLVVSVTEDAYVNKGAGRPRFHLHQRMQMLKELRIVDHVVASRAPTPDAVIIAIRPAIYVKGKEYIGKLPEEELVKSLGGYVRFTDEPVYSSTALCESL